MVNLGRATHRTTLLVAMALLIGMTSLLIGATATSATGAVKLTLQKHSKATGTPGTLIKSKQVTATGVNASAVYAISYWSESVPKNKPVTVTGLVFIPKGTPPKGGWPLVSWAHGTDGMVGACAPSLDPATAVDDVNLVNALLAQGWEVTATDYQGESNRTLLSQQGLLPYLVGDSAARNTIDIVRAASQLSVAHASSNYVVMGHSEGGQSAMFVLNLAASYAPSLNLKGVVAIAPPSQLNVTLIPYVELTGYWPLIYMAAWGWNATYGNGEAPVNELLTSAGLKGKSDVESLCSNLLFDTLDPIGFNTFFKVTTLPSAWQTLANENDPESFNSPSSTPVLIVQGDQDNLVPPSTSAALATHLCGIGQDVERWAYPGLDHGGVVSSGTATADDTKWVADRFAGKSSPDSYVPEGEPGITTTTCP